MTYLTLSKERVCRSLLTNISLTDKQLEEYEKEDKVDQMKDAYLRQTKLLHRLERVVTT